MVEMWIIYPDAGVCEMIGLLFHKPGLSVLGKLDIALHSADYM